MQIFICNTLQTVSFNCRNIILNLEDSDVRCHACQLW